MARKAKPKIQNIDQRSHDAADALADAQNELESFCYAVSHDLRAPLRCIDGFSHVLLHDFGDKLDPQAAEYLHRIVEGTKKMGQLIDELLAISRIQRTELFREHVDLAEVAKQLLARFQQAQLDRQVTIDIQPHLIVNGDRRLLATALEELLENAWKFTSRTPSARIAFGQKRGAKETVFLVQDNGVGFDSEHAERLFKPFQRLHPQSEFPGLGTGLAIARAIIRRHGGRVWSQSAPGKGATFYYTLGNNKSRITKSE